MGYGKICLHYRKHYRKSTTLNSIKGPKQGLFFFRDINNVYNEEIRRVTSRLLWNRKTRSEAGVLKTFLKLLTMRILKVAEGIEITISQLTLNHSNNEHAVVSQADYLFQIQK